LEKEIQELENPAVELNSLDVAFVSSNEGKTDV
jgi:hypothetical protein